jgi:hypothetical protein
MARARSIHGLSHRKSNIPPKDPRSDSSTTKIQEDASKTEARYGLVMEMLDESTKTAANPWIAKPIFQHIFMILAVLAVIIALFFTTLAPNTLQIVPGSCNPAGTFSSFDRYNPWATSGICQMTLGFGSLTFSNVKLIDVNWDVAVSRGSKYRPRPGPSLEVSLTM